MFERFGLKSTSFDHWSANEDITDNWCKERNHLESYMSDYQTAVFARYEKA